MVVWAEYICSVPTCKIRDFNSFKKMNFIGSQVQYTVFNSYKYNYDLLMPHARLLNGELELRARF